MEINITKREYRDLLDILYIADWVLNAHKSSDDPETARYGKLEQKFYSRAKEMGFDNLIEYAPELERYFPTKEFEETITIAGFIDEFENDTFWVELIYRLADRDLARQEGGIENVIKLSTIERIEKSTRLEGYYATEFEANGLGNLKIDRVFGQRKV